MPPFEEGEVHQEEQIPLKPPRRHRKMKSAEEETQAQPPAEDHEEEQLLPPPGATGMSSNLRYARANLSQSSLMLSHQQGSFESSTERTASSETLDVLPTSRRYQVHPQPNRLGSGLRQPASALASALHATARLAASVDAYTAAATAATAATGDYGDYMRQHPHLSHIHPSQSTQQQAPLHHHPQLPAHQLGNLRASNFVGSSRYLYHSQFNSNSPQTRRFTALQRDGSPAFAASAAAASLAAASAVAPLAPLAPLASIASPSFAAQPPPPPPPFQLRTYQQNQSYRFQPRGHHRTASSSMSQSGEDLHSPTYLSWRKLQLSRAKLKASSKTSALLSGFAMVAMVEVQLDHDTNVPEGMLIAFAICTTLLVAVHMLALMISTCILPNIETVCNLHSISLVHESPHERLHWYIETAWAFSTLLGLILFLLEIAILCWVKFYDLSEPAAWSACVVLIPVMVIFMAFAIHFYRSLVSHKYEVTVSGIRELEMLKEQMEQDHLEHHNNIRNNGMNYGASGDIV
ncbi:calcium release-activated calcium channel protein 1 isoform X1 [Drosophila biarmipes]|uniref:calcium release-activated calcium channel protein 1 isoform X1 n=1 Tax=Drosophila biarmipes TaxID=125945 RepID=UPI0007E611D3|nr:calcium release-activated calcium channel protein 1 isoform X1 [Drosophila biarmipes]